MIVVKDMEMPKRCFDCDFYSNEYGCRLKFTEECNPSIERAKDCPLVEIVTCKDCTNYVKGALDEEICLRGHELIHENFYCRYGERRE